MKRPPTPHHLQARERAAMRAAMRAALSVQEELRLGAGAGDGRALSLRRCELSVRSQAW